jgi:DNA-binding response OmpR family regulator
MHIAHTALGKLHFMMLDTHDGENTLRAMRQGGADLLLLDDAIPRIGGVALCRKVRESPLTSSMPIIMITAEDDDARHIEALDNGADDCLARPLRVDMLIAHIKVIARRLARAIPTARLRTGPIDMDLERWILKVGDATIDLTHKEFLLLQALLEAKGRTLSRDVLLQMVWIRDTPLTLESRTVDVHIGRLRRKLGMSVSRYLITVRNVGFRFEPPVEWQTDLGSAGGTPVPGFA